MNQARVRELLKGESNIARKVYEAVPIQAAWTSAQIRVELHRIGGVTNDARVIDGALKSLAERGLIQEPQQGFFKRRPERIYEAPPPPQLVREVVSKPEAPPTAGASPLDALISISERVSSIMGNLGELKKSLDDAAILIEERFAESEGRSAKLKQLQDLLKGLG